MTKWVSFQRNRLLLALLLTIVSAGYFGALSTLDTDFIFKSCAVLLPVQIGASVYLLYLYWTGRLRGTARATQTPRTPPDSAP